MSKKALCVGINDYPFEGNDLNGCVNDAKGWMDVLINNYGFTNIKLLLDSEATKANIMNGLKDLIEGASAGDILVFTNSSHGTYLPDTSMDEPDSYDEAICPYDCQENLIVDDELRELFAGIPTGVSLTVISDSCFSGTVTKAVLSTPDDRRVRFLNPALLNRKAIVKPGKASPNRKINYPESNMKEILLSGCTNKEYSYDALIDGTYHGAMTYYALKTLKNSDYQITLEELHKNINNLLEKEGYDQHPQLEGKKENKLKKIFSL